MIQLIPCLNHVTIQWAYQLQRLHTMLSIWKDNLEWWWVEVVMPLFM